MSGENDFGFGEGFKSATSLGSLGFLDGFNL